MLRKNTGHVFLRSRNRVLRQAGFAVLRAAGLSLSLC